MKVGVYEFVSPSTKHLLMSPSQPANIQQERTNEGEWVLKVRKDFGSIKLMNDDDDW